MAEDVRWKQRFDNFVRALQTLTDAVQLAQVRVLSNLEEQGMIQGFEFTHELAWNVLKDYLEEKGFSGIIGSKDATRLAFKNGLIEDGEAWMEMIKARSLGSQTYIQETAEEIVGKVLECFYPAFERFSRTFTGLAEQVETD